MHKRAASLMLSAGVLVGACADRSEPALETEAAPAEGAAAPALEVLAQGANIAGANGIHFGPDGLLYVASVIGSNLTVLDPESGEVVRELTAEDGVIGPDDVAFAPDGAFYWTSILTGEVAGFDAQGERVVAAQLPPGPNPLTFSDDGRLFVAQCFLGTGLYELDPAGIAEPRLIADDLGPGCGLNGMDWGPDGRLYGPRWFVGEVVSVDVDTGERRLEVDGFTTPAAVKFDSAGVLHVLDTGRGEVVRVDDGAKSVVATLSPGLDNFAFEADDTLFVSSYVDGFVARVDEGGSMTMLQPAGMSHPGGVAVVGDVVWVADLHALRGFDRDSGEEIVTERNIVGVGELGGAINVSSDGENLILTSWFDGDVRIWDPEGRRRVAQIPDLEAPVAAVRYGGALAIAEHGKGAVSLYGEGEPLALATGLPAPTGLAVHEGALYVSDRIQGQILRIARDGEALAGMEVVVRGLDSPEGFVAIDDGFVVIEAAAGRIVHVDAKGDRRELASIPPGSPAATGTPPSQVFNGIALDGDGTLFATGETSRSLYRLAAPGS